MSAVLQLSENYLFMPVARGSRCRGFTLLEVIVASVIVALALIPVFDMISGANKSVASIEDESVAFALATEACEWMHAQSYNELYTARQMEVFAGKNIITDGVEFVEEPVRSFNSTTSMFQYEPEEQFSRFKRVIRIFLPVATEGMPIRVLVEVSWKTKGRKEQENRVQLEFMKFKYK